MHKFIINAKPMSNEHTIDNLIEAFNAQAQTEGRHDSRAFWKAPARSGSIRDMPETDKSKADLAWFRARRLAKEKARETVKPPLVEQGSSAEEIGSAMNEAPPPATPAAPFAPNTALPGRTSSTEH